MAWYRTYLRPDRKRDSKTATGDHGFLRSLTSVLMSLSRSMEVTEKLFPLPKVPLGIEIVAWQLYSDDL